MGRIGIMKNITTQKHKKVEFSDEQMKCVDEMFEELQTKLGQESIRLVMEYQQTYKDRIYSKVDVLEEMGIEFVPIQSLYNMLNEEKEEVEETKFGFQVV